LEKKNIEIIYHVAPLLNPEGHRRLIGNDIGVIFFLESGQFDPSLIDKLGSLPQVYAIVQPIRKNKYQIAFFCNSNLKYFGPPLPKDPVSAGVMKELLLSKIYNGYVKTNFCPPLNRLYYLPRAETLSEIISRYPKEKKQKEKSERKQQEKIDGIWFKTLIHIVIYDDVKDEEKENRPPQFKDSLVQVSQDTIRVIDPKSLLPMYTWDINLLYQWKMPNPKTLIAYFGFQVELSEAVVFKSLDVKKIVSLITSFTTNTPF